MEENSNKHKLDDDDSSQSNSKKKFCPEPPQVLQDDTNSEKSVLKVIDCQKTLEQNLESSETYPIDDSTDTIYRSKYISDEAAGCSGAANDNLEMGDIELAEELQKLQSSPVSNPNKISVAELITLSKKQIFSENVLSLNEALLSENNTTKLTNTISDQVNEDILSTSLEEKSSNYSQFVGEIGSGSRDCWVPIAIQVLTSSQDNTDKKIDDSSSVGLKIQNQLSSISIELTSPVNSSTHDMLPTIDITEQCMPTSSDMTTQDKSPSADSVLEDKLLSVGSIPEDQLPSVDSVLEDQLLSGDSVIEDQLLSGDSVIEEIPSVDSVLEEQLLSIDSVREVKLPSVDSVREFQVPSVDSVKKMQLSCVDSVIEEKVASVNSVIENAPSVDFIIEKKVQISDSVIAEKILSMDSVKEDLPSFDFIIEEKAQSADSIIDQRVLSAVSLIEEKIPFVDFVIEEKVQSAESIIDQRVLGADSLIEENITSVDSVMGDRVQFTVSVIEEKIPSNDSVIEENMSSVDSVIEEKVQSADSVIEDRVLSADSLVQEKIPSVVSVIEEKVQSADSVIEENIPSIDAGIEEKIPSVGPVIEEKIPVDSVIEERAQSTDSIVGEKIPSVVSVIEEKVQSADSVIEEKIPSIDSVIEEKIPSVDTVIEEKISSVDTFIEEKIPSVDYVIEETPQSTDSIREKKIPSVVEEMIPSVIEEKILTADFISYDKSPDALSSAGGILPSADSILQEMSTSVSCIVQSISPSVDSIAQETLPCVDSSAHAASIEQYVSPSIVSTANNKSPSADPTGQTCQYHSSDVGKSTVNSQDNSYGDIIKQTTQPDSCIEQETPCIDFNEDGSLLSIDLNKEVKESLVDSNEKSCEFIPVYCSKQDSLIVSSSKEIVKEKTGHMYDSKACPTNVFDSSIDTLRKSDSEILPEEHSELLTQGILPETKTSGKIYGNGNENTLSDSSSMANAKYTEEMQNKIASSKLRLDNLIEFTNSKVDDVSMQSEATETGISSALVGNSDSLSGTTYSNEDSTAFSTPVESCQVSAASSPKPFDCLPKLSSEQSSLRKRSSSKKKSKQKSKKQKTVPCPMVVDEETCMDANSCSVSGEVAQDDDSRSSTGTSSKKESKKFRTEVIVPDSTEAFTVDKVIEYIWPLDDFGEHYFIQEHISRYLGIMSFKRRYPDIRRRFIEKTEKEYLKERSIVNELACDLGLTAARSEDVMDIIFNDFPEKYEELHKDLRDRKEQKFKEAGRVDYQVVNLDKSKMQEYSKKAAADAARWNLAFNRERFDERRYSFDLQTFTMHRPINRCQKIHPEYTKVGSYPLAVLPGQYTDYYREYSAVELKALPVHSVMTGPFTTEELNADPSQEIVEESIPIKEEQVDTKDNVTTVDTVVATTLDPLSAEKQPRCKECNGGRDRNKVGKAEPLIICGSCRTPSHPTCIELTLSMVRKIESYGWQCMECKTCAHCNDPNDEERMIFCDMCDRGYHIYCVGLRKVPNGRWHCRNCACCFSCGTRSPAGNEVVKVAEWQHEFKKNKQTKEVNYVCTLCLTCDRYWKRRMYCNSCWKVYKNLQEGGMVKCAACPKYIHKEGCSTLLDNENLCNHCVKSRKNTAMNHSRILAAAKKKMAAGF